MSRRPLVAGTACLALTLAACSSPSEGGEQNTDDKDDGATSEVPADFRNYVLPEFPDDHPEYTAIFLHPHELEPWAVSTKIALEEFGAQHGLSVSTYQAGGYAGSNVTTQIQQIENAITQQPDAIIVQATDPGAISDSLQKAVDAGIAVIGYSHLGFDGSVTEAVGDYTSDAYDMADKIFESIGDEGKVMSVFGGRGGQYEREMTEGFQDALAEHDGVESVSDVTIPAFDPASVQDLVMNQLTRDPDIEGIVVTNMGMATGAISAIAGGDTKVIAQVLTDCSQVDLIESGQLAFGQGTPAVYYSQLAVALTIRHLAGEEVPDTVHIPGNIYSSDNIAQAPLWIESSPEFLESCLDPASVGEFQTVPYDEFVERAEAGFES